MDDIDKILKKMAIAFQKAMSNRFIGEESDIDIEIRWNAAFPCLDTFKTPPHMRRSPRLWAEEKPELGMPPD